MNLAFEPLFTELPDVFYTLMLPEGVAKKPELLHYNPLGAKLLDLPPTPENPIEFVQYFSGNQVLPSSKPYAQVYGGHQFGVWAGQLGDGRAISLGTIKNQNNELWEIQLKGSGLTPYSRMGDGRAVLRSSIREYLCSEHMHALGIPTTRVLNLISTGETVQRETLEPGAIITRLSPSFIRLGHFEYFYAKGETQHVKTLADFVIEHFYPEYMGQSNPYALWFEEVLKRTAELMAKWQSIGFCHGVMNTDNFSILGLTLDYGPFGFMENYQPNYICNHSDYHGRYAYNQQPQIGLWNCQTFAYSLQELIDVETLREILMRYENYYQTHFHQLMSKKLGLHPENPQAKTLYQELLNLMQSLKLDFTNTFRLLSNVATSADIETWKEFTQHDEDAKKWLKNYLNQIKTENNIEAVNAMKQINPKFVLRNWVAEKVIRAAEDQNDFSIFETVFKLCTTPFDEHTEYDDYTASMPYEYRNLCVSCSS